MPFLEMIWTALGETPIFIFLLERAQKASTQFAVALMTWLGLQVGGLKFIWLPDSLYNLVWATTNRSQYFIGK